MLPVLLLLMMVVLMLLLLLLHRLLQVYCWVLLPRKASSTSSSSSSRWQLFEAPESQLCVLQLLQQLTQGFMPALHPKPLLLPAQALDPVLLLLLHERCKAAIMEQAAEAGQSAAVDCGGVGGGGGACRRVVVPVGCMVQPLGARGTAALRGCSTGGSAVWMPALLCTSRRHKDNLL